MKTLIASVIEGPAANPASTAQPARYRRDIDGLRAVAIALVVLSHLRINTFVGGFVGVDIFFVISGYLLTGNIAQAIAAGKFSVASFYERRIRRIFPALIAMSTVTSVLAYLLFPPSALILYGQSLLATVLSCSNLYFSTQSSYFALNSTKSLLHTWSLGVEEQFYLVLPICMLLAAKGPRRTTQWVIGLLGLVSFALAAYLTVVDRTLAFYMPYTRAWELLLGSALALKMVPTTTSRPIREALAALSFVLILICVFTYSPSTLFPGAAALLPCVAAAMLIMIGERGPTSVSSFLGWPPAVFIGAISYSLYLWHWPVMLFLSLGIVPRIDVGPFHLLVVAKVVLSFVLAVISWRFIEQPFRTGRWKSVPRLRVFYAAGASTLALVILALTFSVGDGLRNRFPLAADLVGDYLTYSEQNGEQCFVEFDFADFDARRCLAEVPGKANVLLLGDSHAGVLWAGLSQEMPNANVMIASGSACAPIKGNYDHSPCGSLRRFIYENYLPAHRVDAVILSERWGSISDLDALTPALRWLHDRNLPVFVIGPAPEYMGPLPLLLALGLKWHTPGLAERRLLQRMGTLDGALRLAITQHPGVHYASVWKALCPANKCQEYVDFDRGIPMLFDDNHVTDAAGVLAVRRMQSAGELPSEGRAVTGGS